VARSTCFYCGAALPDAARRERAPDATPEVLQPRADRTLIVLDLQGVDPARLARGLGLSLFEARQRVRRGGFDLWRVVSKNDAARELELIAVEGLSVLEIPEAEVRVAARPVVAAGGRSEPGGLILRHEGGRSRLEGSDVLLVVRGPIVREYAPSAEAKRARTATLEPGYRIHLHRRHELQPFELDPGSFDFGAAVTPRSSVLTLLDWVAALAPAAPADELFRRLPPALAPTAAGEIGPATAAAALSPAVRRGRRGSEDARTLLDNVDQFRFYSAWRAAVERRRGGPQA
jgi:hypothetical protein